VDGVCGDDPCDPLAETCNPQTRTCDPFPNRVCFGTDTVCPPNHVCGSNADNSLTVCCPVDASGSANVCSFSYEDGTEGIGCQCTTEFGQQGCMTEDGVCCQAFASPGVCYCAPAGVGCTTENPACADPDNCSYCCNGTCVMEDESSGWGVCA
jgi:hypothetical protein